MPEFTGQLGTPLRITLNSVLLECRWSHEEAMAGAEVTLLIHIGYAGDGNPVQYTIFQEGGSKVATVKGTTFAGVAAAKWTIPDKASGRLTFVAEAKDIDIIGKSDTLRVRAGANIGPAQAQDKDGAKLDKIQLGQNVTWLCRMPGIPDGTGFTWKIWCQLDPSHRQLMAAGFGEVVQSQGKVTWTSQFPGSQGTKLSQSELDRTSETYKNATFQAVFECLAAVAKTAEVGVKSALKATVQGGGAHQPVKAADGKATKESVSETEDLSLDDHAVGSSHLQDPEAK